MLSVSLRSFIAGIGLAVVFSLVVHTIEPQPARQVIALFLAFTACVYPGAVLSQSLAFRFVALELVIAGVVFSLAVVGLRAATTSLVLGYIIHGIWDLIHH